MSMKLIMESWRGHLSEAAIPPLTPTEDEILDLLDKYGTETNEGRLKNWLAAAGLAAAGAGGGVGIGSKRNSSRVQRNHQRPYSRDLCECSRDDFEFSIRFQ